MKDFAYYNPVRVHFGQDALNELGGELAAFGKKKSCWRTAGAALKEPVFTLR